MARLSRTKKKELYHSIKGARDIFGDEYRLREWFIERAKHVATFYGFGPIATPHLERAELFGTTLGGTTDVVQKQMYAFRTRGGESVALRPEGTAPIMRAYIEHGMHTWPQPVLFWYAGNFFRHENPQRGRWREFYQFGLEVLGTEDPVADGLVIHVAVLMLREVGLQNVLVHLNSLGCKECRAVWRKELVAYFRKHGNALCKDCKRRLKENPLRILDCKEERCREASTNAPQSVSYLCAHCKQHFREVLEHLDDAGIAYVLDHLLVRGLDYYSRTTFEIFFEKPGESAESDNSETKTEVGTEESEKKKLLALGGGGRYDYLGEVIGSRNVPAVGMALGVDRIIPLLREHGKIPKSLQEPPKVFFVQLGTTAKRKSLHLMEELRKAKIPLAQSLSKDSLKSQLRIASRLGVFYAAILGQKEALDDTIIIRDMDSGAQETLPFVKSIEYLKSKLRGKGQPRPPEITDEEDE
ncbi:MAG: histidine--tRNA ligase [Parcubacteria group bacterium]|nr:histidine--tRNA ligase [Parcubacteria group bacterium]